MDAPRDPKLPKEIGRYQIRTLIGRGGMGEVYGAFDPSLDRLVALKTIIAGSDNPSLVERLQREARACGRLHHPNIVTIHDLGESQGTVFIAMEWLQGESLADAMKAGKLTFEMKLRALVEILDALDYAHAEGIIHRDIKPSNAWVLPTGQIKLLDFGLARLQHVEALTLPGEVMGTPYYMSPEQLMGQPVDGRSDVFSVGVLAYELFAERRAFEAESITAIIVKVLQETPPPIGASWTGDFPEVEAIITKSIAKLPGDRFGSAQEMGDALRQFIDAHRAEIRQVDGGSISSGATSASRPDTTTAVRPTQAGGRATDLPTATAATYVLGATTPPPRPPYPTPHAAPGIVAAPLPDARSAMHYQDAPAPPVANSAAQDTTVRLDSQHRAEPAYVPPAIAAQPRKTATWILPVAALVILAAGVGTYVTFFSQSGDASTSGAPTSATPALPTTPLATPSNSGSGASTAPAQAQTTPVPVAPPVATPVVQPQDPSSAANQARGNPGGRRGVPVAALKGFSLNDSSTQGLRGMIAARLEERGFVHQLRPLEARYLIRATSTMDVKPGLAGSNSLTADYTGEVEVLDRGTGRIQRQDFDGHAMEFGPSVVRQKAMKELTEKMLDYLVTIIR